MTFKKVLVCAPTAKAKNYCFDEWIDNVMKFTYPDFSVVLFDNTDDGGKNADLLNQKFTDRYPDDGKFVAAHSLSIGGAKKTESVIERMTISHNDCRNWALLKGFDCILHLESDVFPQHDIIETLMFHKKPVIGAVYYRDEGIYRQPMLQRNIHRAPDNVGSIKLDAKEDILAADGSVKQFASIGLGCVLIDKQVLRSIQFRFVSGQNFHPDTYFSQDCYRLKIPIYADTSCIARHDNRAWGKFGIDFK